MTEIYTVYLYLLCALFFILGVGVSELINLYWKD